MKIGILTLPLHTNYGGILQSFALQTVLQRMGHDVIVVGLDRELKEDIFHEAYSFYNYLKQGRKVSYVMNRTINNERREREQNTTLFIEKYINQIKIRCLPKEFPDCFDLIVVGSDQVWRKRTFTGMWGCGIENAYLEFAEKRSIRRIAYAASFGTDEWEYNKEESQRCSKLLSAFNFVGVREREGVELCSRYLGRKDARHVLDPTMLLLKEDYELLVRNASTPKSDGNMMVYFLDEAKEKNELVDVIAKERHLKPFRTNQSDDIIKQDKHAVQPPLENWLRGFMDAEFIITDSFHACVFSIIFNKPFIAFGNKKRGLSRFTSLLTMFGLTDHLIVGKDEYRTNRNYIIPDESNKLISEKRIESLTYLQNSLL